MNKKEKQQIKYLLENLKWYSEAPNEQDYNGEYEPPMEWEQGEAKIFLKYLEEKDKEIERLNEELRFAKLSNPEINLEHWRIVDENKRKIDNLRKGIERLNNIINELDKYIDEIIDERIEKIEGTRFLKGGFTIEQNYLRRRLHERLQELKGDDSNG